MPALTELLKDKDGNVRFHAAVALQTFGPEAKVAVPLLAGLVRDRYVPAGAAARTLEAIGSAAVPALTELLTDKDEEVRLEAVCALRQIDPGATAATSALNKLLRDKNAAIRENAAGALTCIGPEAKTAAPVLAELLRDKAAGVRKAAADALGGSAPKRRWPYRL